MTGPTGKYEPWFPEDEALLRSMLLAGKGVMVVALKLKRTQGSVKARAQRLRISIKDGQPLEKLPIPTADK